MLSVVWSNKSAIIGKKQDYLKKKDENFSFLTWQCGTHCLSK